MGDGGLLGESHSLSLLDSLSLRGNGGLALSGLAQTLLLEDHCGVFIRLAVIVRPVLFVEPVSDGIAGLVPLVWVLLSFFVIQALDPGIFPLCFALLRRVFFINPAFIFRSFDFQPHFCFLTEPGVKSVFANLIIVIAFGAVFIELIPFPIASFSHSDHGVEGEASLLDLWILRHNNVPIILHVFGLFNVLEAHFLGQDGSRCCFLGLECSVLAHNGNSLFQAGSFHCLVLWGHLVDSALHEGPLLICPTVPDRPGFGEQIHHLAVISPIVWLVFITIALVPEIIPLLKAVVAHFQGVDSATVSWSDRGLEVEARVKPLINAILAVISPVFLALPEPIVPLPVAILSQRPVSEAFIGWVLGVPFFLQSLGTLKCEHVELGREGVFLGTESFLTVGGGLHGVMSGLSQFAGLLDKEPVLIGLPILPSPVPEILGFCEEPRDFAFLGPVVCLISVAIALFPESLPLSFASIRAPAFLIKEAVVIWSSGILEHDIINFEPSVDGRLACFSPPLVAVIPEPFPLFLARFFGRLIDVLPREACIIWDLLHGLWLRGLGLLGDGSEHHFLQAFLG